MRWRFLRPSRADLGRFFCGRKREVELRTFRRLALDPDASAVRLDDAFGDRQSEPGPEALGAFGLPVGIEDVAEMLLRDAGAGVRDAEQNHRALERLRVHGDHPARRRELERV